MGRVAKYKKLKKFDLHDNAINREVNKPATRKQNNKLPNSLRQMKYEKEKMLQAEQRRKEQKKLANKPNQQQKKDEDKNKVKKIEGMRDDESFRDFNKRLGEETRATLQDIRVQRRRRSNYMRNLKEKKKEKKKKKAEERELEKNETKREHIAFGEVVDRPPCLSVAPKQKRKHTI